MRAAVYVISLCDWVREICPRFPGPADPVHWSLPDPSREGDTDEATYPAFERLTADVEIRVRFLLYLIDQRSRS
ncbi:hypothetical protein FAIPA1_210103 [Frankia sp. AiPs1]|uniref:hypothetical protein n=1 Tax=Frankia sp. AiPa1 TaxID=573492 RepID=UPI00202B44CC|nr:hypothetical protein [Frankia sp. AiPa1]MCL9758547.1 hypothetical protein [Frankia sp. AiPa1]